MRRKKWRTILQTLKRRMSRRGKVVARDLTFGLNFGQCTAIWYTHGGEKEGTKWVMGPH